MCAVHVLLLRARRTQTATWQRHCIRRHSGPALFQTSSIKAWVKTKCRVAFQWACKDESASAIAVFVKQLDQAVDAFGQHLDRKVTSSIISGGAVARYAPLPGKGFLADLPQLVCRCRVGAEVDLLFPAPVGN